VRADDGEGGGTFWMLSASKQVKLVGAAQSHLIAGITDALRTATMDHSKVFEVMALLSAIADTISGKRH
jgi:flavin-binding protein dodecin